MGIPSLRVAPQKYLSLINPLEDPEIIISAPMVLMLKLDIQFMALVFLVFPESKRVPVHGDGNAPSERRLRKEINYETTWC